MTGSMIHNIHAWPGVYTTPKACFSHVKDGQLLHRKHVSLRNTISITVIKFSVFVQIGRASCRERVSSPV